MNTTLSPAKSPIVTVSVRGGVAGVARSNIPVNLIVEDWDCDEETAPDRYALKAEALAADDEAELIRQLELAPHGNAELSECDIDNLIQQLLRRRRQVAVIFCVADVKGIRPDLSDEQCWDVLERCMDQHDCEWGFTWSFITDIAQELFGDTPETDEEIAIPVQAVTSTLEE